MIDLAEERSMLQDELSVGSSQAGLAPPAHAGGLEHGLVWGYRILPGGGFEPLDGADLDEISCAADARLWLHFDLGDNRARRWIENCPRVPAAARAMLLGSEERAGVASVDSGIAGVVGDLHYDFAFDP